MFERLTEEQRELAAKSHNLIYSYIYSKGVSLDECYDILAIALCNATKGYDDEKGAFSTYAYKCFNNALLAHWKKEQKECDISGINATSIEALEDLGYSYCEDSLLNDDSYENAVYNIMCDEFAKTLSKKEKEVFRYLLNGVSQVDIARKFDCKKQSVFCYVEKIRKKLSAYLEIGNVVC